MDTWIHAYIYLFCTLHILQEVVKTTPLYVYKQLLRAHLEHIPSSPLSHAKEGEVSHSWCLQRMDGEGQRYVLPKWIGDVLEVQVCLFVGDHSKWEKNIREVSSRKTIDKVQKKSYEEWQSRCEPRLVFSAAKKKQVTDARQVKKDKSCLAIQLHLSESPEELQVSAWDGSRYLLLLLRGCPQKQTVPEARETANVEVF